MYVPTYLPTSTSLLHSSHLVGFVLILSQDHWALTALQADWSKLTFLGIDVLMDTWYLVFSCTIPIIFKAEQTLGLATRFALQLNNFNLGGRKLEWLEWLDYCWNELWLTHKLIPLIDRSFLFSTINTDTSLPPKVWNRTMLLLLLRSTWPLFLLLPTSLCRSKNNINIFISLCPSRGDAFHWHVDFPVWSLLDPVLQLSVPYCISFSRI